MNALENKQIEYFDTDLVNRALGTPVDVSTESHG